MGVDACTRDPNDPTRLPSAQREQQRDDGKASKEISKPCRNVDEDDDSNEEELSSDDEVQFGDEHVPSRGPKITTSHAHKKPKVGGLYDMFDVKGREGVDLETIIFFLACGIPFNATCSPYFEQMVHVINHRPLGYKASGYENF